MTTGADERLDEADKAISQAVKLLMQVVVDHYDGWEEYNASYREELHCALVSLIEIKKLNR